LDNNKEPKGELQPKHALYVIWTIGTAFIFYLIFFSKTDTSVKVSYANNDLVKNDIGNNHLTDAQKDQPEVKDAYVFINVNKKHFLTRFVSIVPDEHTENTPLQKGTDSVKMISVEKINKIIKTRPVKKTNDFIIKTAPDL
jgi:hypothetical protein